MNDAVEAFNSAELNKPADGEKFNIVINGNSGYKFNGNALCFYDGNANAGGYAMAYMDIPGSFYNQVVTMIPVGNKNEYYLSFYAADGTQKYVGTGKSGGYTTSSQQLRAVDSQDKAVSFKIEVTSADGLYHLRNMEYDALVSGNAEGDNGFFTAGKQWNNFNLISAATNTATVKVTEAQWATFIAPFDAELPADVKAYTCDGIKEDGETLGLTEATELKANVPYILYAENPVEEAVEGYALANKATYVGGLLTGVYAKTQVAKDARNYALQNNDGVVGFYSVDTDGVFCAANRAYFTAPESTSAKAFKLGTTGSVTAIDAVKDLLGGAEVVERYDEAGRKVSGPVKGLNIVKLSNGKVLKIVIK